MTGVKGAALLAVLCLVAGQGVAQTLPALFDVSGVAADDALNIRAEPGAKSEIIGQLAPDDRAIEVVRREGNWGLINAGEGAGWVYLKYMAPRSDADWSAMKGPMRCFGTEPFWSLTLRPAQGDVRREEPGAEAQSLPLVAATGADGRATARFGDATAGGDLTLIGGSCSDGMSDRSFGITVSGRLRPGLGGASGEAALTGCCSVEP